MNRAVFSLLLLSFSSSAFAWKHIDPSPYKWPPESMPIQFYVDDDGTPETNCEETVEPGYCITSTIEGFNAWNDATCAEISSEYAGYAEGTGFQNGDGRNVFSYNDPLNQLDSPGTLGATLCRRVGLPIFTFNGVDYQEATDCDIVFNKNIKFASQEDIAAGQCGGATNLRAVATHEIGHLLGMGHSCEEGEVCTDPLLANATMFWSDGPCSLEQSTINEDDIEGITALYGPYASFICSNLVDVEDNALAVGNVPFDLKCGVVSDVSEELTSAEWNWGDGNSSNGITGATHTYTKAGNFTVRVHFQGERASCGTWDSDFRKVGYVRACSVPDAALSLEPIDGLTYQLLNETNISVYGCINDIQWDIYEGSSAPSCDSIGPRPLAPNADATQDEWDAYDADVASWESDKEGFEACASKGRIGSIKAWEPEFTFPTRGTYTVVVNVGGRAGTGAAELTVDIDKVSKGCDTVGLGAAGTSGVMLLCGLLAVRRRRA